MPLDSRRVEPCAGRPGARLGAAEWAGATTRATGVDETARVLTEDDIERFLAVLTDAIQRLRARL